MRKPTSVTIDDVAHVAGTLAGVRRTAPGGLAEWRYHGRLVARQLDDARLVIRADFDYRDSVTGPDLLSPGYAGHWPLPRAPLGLETSVPGAFAAGDVRLGSMKRVARRSVRERCRSISCTVYLATI
jgi:hypothetical protein